MLNLKKQNHLLLMVKLLFFFLSAIKFLRMNSLVVNQIGDNSIRATLEELFRGTVLCLKKEKNRRIDS